MLTLVIYDQAARRAPSARVIIGAADTLALAALFARYGPAGRKAEQET